MGEAERMSEAKTLKEKVEGKAWISGIIFKAELPLTDEKLAEKFIEPFKRIDDEMRMAMKRIIDEHRRMLNEIERMLEKW
jgi:hypothetical protein